MRLLRCDIGNSGEVHKTYLEFCDDLKKPRPKPEIWFYNFADENYYCYLAKHGKKIVGMVWGRFCPYYEKNLVEVDGFFIRRGFRGKMKFIRGTVERFKEAIKEYDIKKVHWATHKQYRERAIT